MTIPFKTAISLLTFFVLMVIVWNLNTGYVTLSISDYMNIGENSQIGQLRINRVLAMILAGICIPTSGFVLQEYFQNPLAGPEVLGITSIASLSVAIYIFAADDVVIPEILQNSFLNISAILGSFLMLILLLSFSKKISNSSFLIIFGFLISALAGAIISFMQFYADNQSLKNYVLWSFGANNQLSNNQLLILGITTIIGLWVCFKTIKPLMANSLGLQYAQSLGVNLKQLQYLVIISSSLLSASIAAFMGPILFVGIVVPHFSRMIFNPSKLWHQWILNILIGILMMQLFSTISEILGIPINVISSLFGIPVILLMLIKTNKA